MSLHPFIAELRRPSILAYTHTYVWCAPDQNITSQYNWQVHFHNFFLSSSPPPRPSLVGGLAFQMIWSITLSKFANWGTQPSATRSIVQYILMYVCMYTTYPTSWLEPVIFSRRHSWRDITHSLLWIWPKKSRWLVMWSSEIIRICTTTPWHLLLSSKFRYLQGILYIVESQIGI